MSGITNSNLSYQTKLRLNEINKIKDYFNLGIQERKIMSKKLTKYVTLIVLPATSGEVSIISFESVIGVSAGIASASFTLAFSLVTGILKNVLSITRNKKKKHNKIFMLTKK